MNPRNAKPSAPAATGVRADRSTSGTINFTPAAHALKAAVIHAGHSRAIPPGVASRLISTIGRKATPSEGRALRWCLLLAINAGRIRTMEAERAARCLGGWL